MKLEQLRNDLTGSRVLDILFGGFIDTEESPPRFRALQNCLFVDIGGRFVRFLSQDSTGTMVCSFVSEVHCEGVDDDLEFAVCSLRDNLLDDPEGENPIVSLRLWDSKDESAGVCCFAAEIEVSNGQTIFIDPSYHFGIRVGCSLLKTLWFKNWPSAPHLSEREISLS